MTSLLSRTPLFADEQVVRAIDALPNRVNESGFDAWGFSPAAAKQAYSFGKKFLWPYFRPEVEGIENIPPGRVLLIANHAGQLPIDGVVVSMAVLLRGQPPRLIRAMVDRWFPTLPFINELMWRGGAVLGDPVNCRNLLNDDQALLVFPEGHDGCGKLWNERYKLIHFNRGFMRLALQTNTPIVPVSIVGGEETIISVYNWKSAARLLGFPYFPISPLLPVLGLGAYLPLPAKFHLRFGAPMRFTGAHDDEDSVIDDKVAAVRAKVQEMVDNGLRDRKEIFR